MKKALIVANSSGLITMFLKNDVELLKEKGYEIECACNTNYSDSNTEEFFRKYNIIVNHVGFPIRNLDVKMINSSYIKLKTLIRIGDFNVVHCHSTIAAVLTRQCTKKYRRTGLKVFYTSHGFPYYKGARGKKITLYKIIEQYYSCFTDAIITICQEDYENAKKMYCNNVYKLRGVGIDLSRFDIPNFDRDQYREKLGLKRKDKVLLSVGELNTNKNHQIVIRALFKLKDENIVYVICGREVTEKGKKQELSELAMHLGIKLIFLGYRPDIPEICRSCDIGVISSFKEGLGLCGVEMIASGIVVVGSNRQGIKDYIIDGKTGYLCDPESADSFADGIQKAFNLVQDDNVRNDCIATSKMFSVEDSRKKIKLIYSELLGD